MHIEMIDLLVNILFACEKQCDSSVTEKGLSPFQLMFYSYKPPGLNAVLKLLTVKF